MLQAGESFWTEGCSQRCECHAPSDLRCSAASCTPEQECTIRNGQLGCFDAMSTCTVWGDPHYITFDGAVAHFQGTCSYIITESVSQGSNETQFQVIATNNHRGNNRVSFVSAVDIYIGTRTEQAHIRVGPNKRVKVIYYLFLDKPFSTAACCKNMEHQASSSSCLFLQSLIPSR